MRYIKKTFTYDRFNRLVSADAKNLSGTVTHASQGVQFDGKGNITQKDGAGGYAYGGGNPYAVTTLVPEMAVTGVFNDQTVTYTPFDKVGTVCQDGRTLSVDYGIDRQRVTQTLNDGSSRRTKRYFTPLYETVTENGVTKKLHYLTAANGIFAIFVSASTGENTMYYTLKDHQGSLTATVHGNTVERLSYDPWGRRRNTTGFGYGNVSHTFDRGYTLHEHYDDFDLINMNGRLYDPILGRMLSPDVVIQDEQSSQAYNRYSYCFNNPLRFTDPSGYMVRGSSSLFNGFTLFLYESPHNKGVLFNTDEALGQQLPKIEPFGEEEKKAYIAYRNTVFSYDTKEFKTIQTELIRLENAEEVFRVRMGENTTSEAGGGNFIYNKETGEFDVNIADYGDFSTMGKIAHELKHADQYMKNELGFDLQTGIILAYDINDEIEAFSRQGMFGKTLSENEVRNHPSYKSLPNMKSNLTIDKLQNMRPSYPFDEMKRLNQLYQEHCKVRFLYHGWQNDIK
jgi:RHS repeat-associated protein